MSSYCHPHLVAKLVFGELTLGDAVTLAGPDSIEVITSHEEGGDFDNFFEKDGFFFLGGIDEESFEFVFALDQKVDFRDEHIYLTQPHAEYRLTFFRKNRAVNLLEALKISPSAR